MRVHQTASLIAALLLQLAFNNSAAFAASSPSGITVTAIADGAWSSAATWSNGRVPSAGDDVIVPNGRTLTYDVLGSPNLHTLSLYGTLNFSNTVSTALNIGVIKIGADAKDSSATCNGSLPTAPALGSLYVGKPGSPIPRGLSATINLVAFSDQSAGDAPGLLNCGGRLTVQGATIINPWTRLTAGVGPGATTISVADDISDWKVGDSIIVVGTNNSKSNFSSNPPTYRGGTNPTTEQRTITTISGKAITLNTPLTNYHDSYQGNNTEVANLTRTVTVQSASTASTAERGHTMYFAYSSGSIAYARFEGLGKEANLGRYPIHLHEVSDTMRGFSAIGNAVTNGGYKFITIHGGDFIVLRDNVGYKTNTSGYFLEDGSEVYNVLDHNLAVNAFDGQVSANESLSFLDGEGHGFWWANGRNTFINNQSAENDSWGYFFQIAKVSRYEGTTYSSPQALVTPMLQPNGSRVNTTINSVPFYRFDSNSCHNEHQWCYTIHGGMWTLSKPSVLKNFKAWSVHYSGTTESNGVLVDGLTAVNSNYGPSVKGNGDIPWPDNGARDVTMKNVIVEGAGTLGGDFGAATSNVNFINFSISNSTFAPTSNYNGSTKYPSIMTFVNLSKSGLYGPSATSPYSWEPINYFLDGNNPSTSTIAPVIFINDFYGPGIAAKLASSDFIPNDGLRYVKDTSIGGRYMVAARSPNNTSYAVPNPIDDLPPATAITSFGSVNDGTSVSLSNGSLTLQGVSTDNGTITSVSVNGISATPLVSDYSRWQVTIPGLSTGSYTVVAQAVDAAGNVELNPHSLTLNLKNTGASIVTSPLGITTTAIPAATAGLAYSTALQASGGTPPYSWSISSALPSGMVFASNGTLSGTPTAPGTYAIAAKVVDAVQSSQSRTYSLSVTQPLAARPIATLSITTASLAPAATGAAYTANLSATGGTPPYTWSLASGSLPVGITLSSTGTLSGTPSTSGTSNFTVALRDGLSATVTKSLSLQVASSTPSGVIARIDTGSTTAYTDSTGKVWSADQFASGGISYLKAGEIAAGNAPQPLFTSERYGQKIVYSIPVPANGNYQVNLLFNELYFGSASSPASGGGCTGKRIFDIALESTQVADNFDICAIAGGADKQTVMSRVVSVTDGVLTVTLDATPSVGGVDNAKIDAIEVLASTQQPPVAASSVIARIDTGSTTAYTDSTGKIWSADQFASGGISYLKTSEIAAGSAPQPLFTSERYGQKIVYSIPVPANGNYQVNLLFNELYFGSASSPASGGGCTGKRIFDIALESTQVADNFDICAIAGGADKQTVMSRVVSVTDGVLTVTLDATPSVGGVDNAKIDAIEVLTSP
jgi:hypothetical protein